MYIEIIDDNAELTRNLKKALIKKWHWVKFYNTTDSFMHTSDFSADLFLMDINLWDGNGLDLIENMRITKKINSPIIVISGQTRTWTKKKSFVIWADDYLEKPFTLSDLEERISNIFTHVESHTKKEYWCSHKPLFSCLSQWEKIKMFQN